jgi:hypothetical protein
MSQTGPPVRERLREVLREEGMRGVWWRGLGVTVYRRVVFFTREVAASASVPPSDLELSVAYLVPGEVDDYLRFRPEVPAAEVDRRLAGGQRCVIVRHNGSIVSSRWVSTGLAEVPYLELVFELPGGVAYTYDVYTSEALRGRKLTGASRSHYESLVADEGVTTLLGTAWPENPAGLRMVRAAGYRPIGTVGSLRLGPLRIPVRRIPPGYLGRASRFHPSD